MRYPYLRGEIHLDEDSFQRPFLEQPQQLHTS